MLSGLRLIPAIMVVGTSLDDEEEMVGGAVVFGEITARWHSAVKQQFYAIYIQYCAGKQKSKFPLPYH